MTERTFGDVYDQLRRSIVIPRETARALTAIPVEDHERAFTVVGGNGHVYLTGPAASLDQATQAKWERASRANPGFMYLQGRFVEGDRPNGNGQYWTTRDLELSQPTVAGGPLNWLHDERLIVGALVDSKLVKVDRATAAVGGPGNHIVAMSAFWRFLHPEKAGIVEKASLDKALWYSMECVADTVTCLDVPGRPGCGETFPYSDVLNQPNRICAHLGQRTSARRMNDPTFLGGAVIVPPVRPGWGEADAQVIRQAAMVTEQEDLAGGNLTKGDAERMVAQVLSYASS